MRGMLECVANVSEGRSRSVLDSLAAACGSSLLDVHADPDHHRSVFTMGGPLTAVEDAARHLAAACVEHVDVSRHTGVHPRVGALDVVPFVALDQSEGDTAVAAARRFAAWLGDELGVPAFLYDEADEEGRSLPALRTDAFRRRTPDCGPPAPHPTMGACAVGARPVLVAVNCLLSSDDAVLAAQIARSVRERDGGLPGVRALGVLLTSRRRAQVAMNLVDLRQTGLEEACTAVATTAADHGLHVEAVELVGLVPRAELERCSTDFRTWAGLDPGVTIEGRLEQAGFSPT